MATKGKDTVVLIIESIIEKTKAVFQWLKLKWKEFFHAEQLTPEQLSSQVRLLQWFMKGLFLATLISVARVLIRVARR